MSSLRNPGRLITLALILIFVIVLGIQIGGRALHRHLYTGPESTPVSSTVATPAAAARNICAAGQTVANAANYQAHALAGQPRTLLANQSVLISPDPKKTTYTPMTFTDGMKVSTAKHLLIEKVETIQAVACLQRTDEVKTAKTCPYDTTTLTVYDPHYRLNVYAAKTRKLLASTNIASVPAASFVCPPSISYDSSTKRQYLPPDGALLEQALQPYL
jgi:hypothetical protein